MKNLPTTPEKFAELVGYKPKYISRGIDGDPNPVKLICFRDWNGFSATVEFGCKINREKRGFYFYFEIIDLNDYKEMDFIPLDSSRRHNVILSWPKTYTDYEKLALEVRESLKSLYARKNSKRSLLHLSEKN